MIDIDTFQEMASHLFKAIPEELLRSLNGGMILSEESRQGEEDLPDVYILGEYVEDPHLGCYIVLYHGSFVALFENESEDVWRDELWETMVHELRHHVERQAGVSDLDIEDMRALDDFRRMAQPEPERDTD